MRHQAGTRQRPLAHGPSAWAQGTSRLVGLLETRHQDERGHLATDLGVEAITGEQLVRTLAPPARVSDPIEAAPMARQQAFRRDPIRPVPRLAPLAAVFVATIGDGFATLGEDEINRGAIDALERELGPDRALPTWPGAVPRLEPGPSEGFVIEHAELEHPFDRTVYEDRSIPGSGEAPADLGHGPRARLQESSGGRQNGLWVLDRRPSFAPLRERLMPRAGYRGSPSGSSHTSESSNFKLMATSSVGSPTTSGT